MRSILPILLLTAAPVFAGDFKRDIAPILKDKCWSCHSEKAKKEKAGYVFDNLERFAKDIGRAGIVVPRDPSRSRLYEVVVMDENGDNAMPPPGKPRLTPKEVKALREWIEEGAELEKGSSKPEAGDDPETKNGTDKKDEKPMEEKKAPPAAEVPAGPLLDWTNTSGKTIQASFVKLDGEKLTIRTKEGKSHTLKLSQLNEASQGQARHEAVKAERAAK